MPIFFYLVFWKTFYDGNKSSIDVSCFHSLRRQLEKLDSKSSIAFAKLTDKLESFPDALESELVEFEN